jgi:hypothetical protein
MKLRIRGTSIRLRVSKGELAQIAEVGSVEDVIRFSADTALRYRLEVKPAGVIEADFAASSLRISIPRAHVAHWLQPSEVAIEAQQAVAGQESLRILVEKDYTCLAPRADEDDSDLFANPQAATKA